MREPFRWRSSKAFDLMRDGSLIDPTGSSFAAGNLSASAVALSVRRQHDMRGRDPIRGLGHLCPGERPVLEADRVLATIMFVDIVQSTQRATAIGDSRWRDLVGNYQQQVGKEVARLGGRVVNTAGDGVFAIFDGPARAIKCARAVRDVIGTLGLATRPRSSRSNLSNAGSTNQA